MKFLNKKIIGIVLSGLLAFANPSFAAWDVNTLLMIYANGADGATTYVAETGQTVTFVGTAQLDTAQAKNGASSVLLDGNSDVITVLDSSNWVFGTNGEFDIWIRFNSFKGADYSCIYSHDTDATHRVFFAIYTNNNPVFYFNDGTGLKALMDVTISALSVNTWYHFSVIKVGDNWTMALGGAAIDTAVDSTAFPDFTGAFTIGGRPADAGVYLDGWVDNIRFSNVPRWTSFPFTPPANESDYESGPANIKSVSGVARASLGKVSGVDIANVKSVSGVN